MKIKLRIIIPTILLVLFSGTVLYANYGQPTPEQLKVTKDKKLTEQLTTTITKTETKKTFVENVKPIDIPIGKKIESISNQELVSFRAEKTNDFDIRVKLKGTDSELPFNNISRHEWIDSERVLVVSYETQKGKTTDNFLYKINSEDKAQGVYIYNIKTNKSVKIWNTINGDLFYDAMVRKMENQSVIALNTTQTIEIIDLEGNKIKTLFYNLDYGDFNKSYISLDLKNENKSKILFDVLNLSKNTKSFNLDIL